MWGISALFKDIFIIVQDAGHWDRVETNTELPPEMCVCAYHILLGSEITAAALRPYRAGSATVKPQVTLHLLPLQV